VGGIFHTATSTPEVTRRSANLWRRPGLHRAGQPWQAEHLISAARHHVLALACLRLGYPTMYS